MKISMPADEITDLERFNDQLAEPAIVKDHICVCICTLRRNEMLKRLLGRLALQQTAGFDISVVVVDNDAAGPARQVVTQMAQSFPFEIAYAVEPQQMIPIARNHALRLAKGNYIALIDDDEFPPPHWLLTLYHAIQTFGVEGALGPVYPFFEHEPPAWILKSKPFDFSKPRTGTLMKWTESYTGNVLVKKAVIDTHGIFFDESFRTGGSDQDFFRRAIEKGCRFVSVAEAPVYEIVPPARWTRKYLLNRAFVNGFNSYKYASSAKDRSMAVSLIFKSVCAFAAYALITPLWVCLRRRPLIHYLEKMCYHLSRISATAGIELRKRRDF